MRCLLNEEIIYDVSLLSSVITLVGCNASKIETDGIIIDKVYIFESDGVSNVEKNSTIYINENTRIDCNIKWSYIVKHVTNSYSVPTIEILSPKQYMYYIYLNDEIIETNIDLYAKSEYKEIGYKITHNILDSNAEFLFNTGHRFIIKEEGNYKIECFLTIRVNGEEVESSDSFEFKTIKSNNRSEQ